MNRTTAGRFFAVAGLFVLVACSGPVERETGVLNTDSAALMRVAENARAAGDPAAAIPLYRRAAQMSPDSPAPWLALGKTLNQMRAYAEAANAWRQALQIDPRNVDALVGHGTTLTGLNQPHLALARFQAALEAAPRGRTPALHNAIGVAYDMMGRPEQAQASYRDGLRRDTDNLSLISNLGLSLALQGKYRESIATLERAAALPGARARHRQNLALAYGLAGATEQAAQVARIDLDEQLVMQNLSYYAILRDMVGHAAKVEAVGSLRNGRSLIGTAGGARN